MVWWAPPLVALGGWFAWNVIHEGAHALTALAAGVKVTSFKPWPHKHDGKWRFAGVVYDRQGPAVGVVMPYIVDAVAVVGLSIWAWLSSPLTFSFLLGTLALPVVNTCVGVQARLRMNERADLSRAHQAWALIFFYLLLCYVVNVAALIVVKGVL